MQKSSLRFCIEFGEIPAEYSVRGQEIVTTLDRPEGGDIIQDYGRKAGKFFREDPRRRFLRSSGVIF